MAVLALAVTAVQPASANDVGIDFSKLPEPKKYELLPEKDFEAQTKKIDEVDPFNEPKASYSMRIPKDWSDNIQKAPVATDPAQSLLSDNVLGILGRYIAKPKNLLRSYLIVEAQTLGYEISVKNWFINFILTNGFSLSALKQHGPRKLEALYVQVEGDQSYVVRAVVQINGSALIMARYYLPQENYEEERPQQEQIMNSFELTKPSDEHVEKQGTYGFLDQSYFNYPASWTLKEKSILSVERMSALLLQSRVEGKGRKARYILEGHFKINVISKLLKTSLQEEIQKFRDKLNIPKYTIGALVEDLKYDYDPSIKSARAQVYKLVPTDSVSMQDYEFVVTVMEGDDYYYITSMITPSRTEDFYLWAQNMEAAKVINESVRRYDTKLDENPDDPYYDYLKETPQ